MPELDQIVPEAEAVATVPQSAHKYTLTFPINDIVEAFVDFGRDSFPGFDFFSDFDFSPAMNEIADVAQDYDIKFDPESGADTEIADRISMAMSDANRWSEEQGFFKTVEGAIKESLGVFSDYKFDYSLDEESENIGETGSELRVYGKARGITNVEVFWDEVKVTMMSDIFYIANDVMVKSNYNLIEGKTRMLSSEDFMDLVDYYREQGGEERPRVDLDSIGNTYSYQDYKKNLITALKDLGFKIK